MYIRLLYLSLLLLQAVLVGAQTTVYHPFPTDTARWGMYQSRTYYTSGGQISLFTESNYTDELRGDTIINNLTYSKVYSYNILLGALREDANRRVWFYGFTTAHGGNSGGLFDFPLPPYVPGTELLLYDFSLNVGDSVKHYATFAYAPSPMDQDSIISKVIGVDSLQLLDGSYRRMLEIEARTFPDTNGNVNIVNYLYWVEGIGALRGSNRQVLNGTIPISSDPIEDNGLFGSVFFEVINVSGQIESAMVSCFFDHTNQLLGVNGNAVCSNVLPLRQVPAVSTTVRVAPNPFSEQTTLTIESAQGYASYRVLVYNAMGQLVRQVQSTQATLILSGKDLATGLYFYQVLGEKELLHTGKLVIE